MLYVTKCNTNCYTRIYKDVHNLNNGEQYTMKSCNVGNQLPKDLKDSSTYNLGRILKKYLKVLIRNLKVYYLGCEQLARQGIEEGGGLHVF